MEIGRIRYQGVLNILSFNRHFYVLGLLALFFLVASFFLVDWSLPLFWVIIALFLYGLTMPLLVSAYVYDFSGFYEFDWLRRMNLPDSSNQFNFNINAGFDETSFII